MQIWAIARLFYVNYVELCGLAFRVFILPIPRISTHLIQSTLYLPVKLLFSFTGIRVKLRDVSSAAWCNIESNILAATALSYWALAGRTLQVALAVGGGGNPRERGSC